MVKLTRRLAVAGWILGAAGAAQGASFTPCDDAASKAELNGSLCARESVAGDPSGAAGAPAAPCRHNSLH